MKRDMDLVRLILLKIEEEYVSTALYNIEIDGYDKETIAYHCKILHEAGFVSDYGSQYADNALYSFGVGSLTWEGNEFLDKISLNYSCTSGTASENGCALSDSCKADNLTSFPLKKGALRPWVFRSSFNEVSLKLSRYTG